MNAVGHPAARLSFVQLLEKSGGFQFLHQSHIDKTFRISRGSLRGTRCNIIEQSFYAFSVGIWDFREGGIVSAIGALQTLWIGGLEIFADEGFGFLLVRLDKVKRFGEGA